MEEELQQLMSTFNSKIGNSENPIPLNMHKIFTVSVLTILWSMMAGVRFSHDDERLKTFVHTLSEIIGLFSASGNIFIAFPFLRHVITALTGYGAKRKIFVPTMHTLFKVV